MTNTHFRTFVVRLAVVVAVACAAWYFGVRPLRDSLQLKKAALMAAQQEIQEGELLLRESEREPAEVIEELQQSAEALREFWNASSDASMIYESIDTIAMRHAIIVERMEPKRSPKGARSGSAAADEPAFDQIAYSIELVGSYEGVSRFLHAIQTELGMARVDSIRVGPAATESNPNRVRASVMTTHFQSSGGLASFDQASKELTTP
jgi:Tfp pilus assembly protein PilO